MNTANGKLKVMESSSSGETPGSFINKESNNLNNLQMQLFEIAEQFLKDTSTNIVKLTCVYDT